MSAPFKRTRPHLIGDPVATQIVSIDVDEDMHVMLEEGSDVLRGTVIHVERKLEVHVDVGRALVISRDFHAEKLLDFLPIEILDDLGVNSVNGEESGSQGRVVLDLLVA